MKKRAGKRKKSFNGYLFLFQKIFIAIGRPVFYLLRFIFWLLKLTFLILTGLLIFLSHLINNSLKRLFLIKISLKIPKKKSFKKIKSIKTKVLFPIKFVKRKIIGLLSNSIILLLIVFFAAGFVYVSISVFKDLPSPQKLSADNQVLTTKIYDRNGTLLYKIYRDKDRSPITLTQLPKNMINATIAIEDKDFYKHAGISWRGIIRAVYQNIFKGQRTGGSTITQQLVKNVLLTPQKTWQRKIKEIVLALITEKIYTKDQILEMYLNEVGYGGTAYGIEEASQKYFDKKSSDLTLAESAFLAGLPVSPTTYSPFGNNLQLAKTRQALVLNKMVENGYITEEENITAKAQSLNFSSPKIEIQSPHFVMYVRDLLIKEYGLNKIEQGGLEVITSLDLNLQKKAQEIVSEEINRLASLKITNGAALVTNPKTGEILAMVGSKDYFATDIDGNFNITTALRQPGSSIKPVNYSIALENGFTPASIIDDSVITYRIPGQPAYTPRNYDNRFHGKVTLRTALGSSYNIPAVKILATFGVQKMIERGRNMGITTWINPSNYGLSLTLGGGEIKMVDLATAYGVLANNGIKVNLSPILEIKDSKGKILFKNPLISAAEVLNPGVAFLLTDILSDNNARTPAFGSNSKLNIPGRPVAVKTGTTQNLRDNWTIGYTPSKLVAVWVGNNDNTPMSYVASGVTGASPIWRNIMDFLLKDNPTEYFQRPGNVIEVDICTITNTLVCEGCPNVKREYFLIGTEPKTTCTFEKIKEIEEKKLQILNPQIL